MPVPNEARQKILIVDDRSENLLVLERVLAGCGAELVRAEGGEEALRLTLHEPYALAILDVQMPEMDGYELAEYLRGAAATRTLPIIFLTAVHSDEQHVFRGYEAGAVDFLTKPYRPEILRAKVRVFLEMDRQRRALEAAVETERAHRWLEQILLRLSDAVLVAGRDGRIERVNQALSTLLGRERQALVGAALDEVLLDAEGMPAFAGLSASLRAGRAGELALTNRGQTLSGASGCAKSVLASAAPLYADGGELAGAVLMLKDVSEIEAAREALSLSERKYRRLFDSSRDAIALVGLDGTIADANEAFEALAADGSGERGIFELLSLPAAAAEGGAAALAERIAQQDSLVRGDGTVVPVQASAWPCEAAAGDRPTVWLSLFDLSEERRRQQERIVGEKMATLGMMMGGVAHELNNPLMGVINYVEYCLAKGESGDECHEVLSDARRETKRCLDLVQNLLLVARTGRAEGEASAETDIAALCQRVLRLLHYRVVKEGVQIETVLEAVRGPVRTRAEPLQQVLLNLIVNALDAMQQAERRVLRLEAEADPGRGARILVVDTGSGMTPAVRARIFEPFFTTKGAGKGTGLGLSVSKGLIEDLGGTLACESQPGQGSRFLIELPSLAADAPEQTQ